MDPETLAKLPKIYGLDGEPFRIGDENFFDVWSMHNHTRDSVDGSKNLTLETLLTAADERGITHIVVSEHDKEPAAMTQVEGDSVSTIDRRGNARLVKGIEQRTQYYEFNIIGLNYTDLDTIMRTPMFGRHYDFDSLMERITFFRGKDSNVVVGLNHPFSGQLIPGWNKIKKNVREGFDFKRYILDHWDLEDVKSHIELGGNEDLHESYHSFVRNKLEAIADPGLENNDQYKVRKWLATDKKAYQRMLSTLNIDVFVYGYMREKPNNENFNQHEEIMKGLMSHFDYVELNTFNYYKKDAKKARQLAEKYNKPIMIGEDAHFEGMVGTKGFNLASNYRPLRESLKIGSVQPVVTELYRNSVLNTLTTAFYRILGGLNKQKKMF